MHARKILTTAIVAASLLGSGAVIVRSAPQSPAIRGNTTRQDAQDVVRSAPQLPPKRGDDSIVVPDLHCTMLWADERLISSEIPGLIKRRAVKEGDTVKAEQVLAELDADEATLDLEIQRMILEEAELEEYIQAAKLEEYYTRRDAAERLAPSGAISREEFRLAFVNVRVNELLSKQAVKKNATESLKAKLKEVILNKHTITSPIDGIVQKTFRREKEWVPANEPQMFRIVATDRVWVEARVEARHIYRVRNGQKVEVRLVFYEEADPEGASKSIGKKEIELPEARQPFDGEIILIDTDVEKVGGRFMVRAELPNPDGRLHAGLRVKMTIRPSGPETAAGETQQ